MASADCFALSVHDYEALPR